MKCCNGDIYPLKYTYLEICDRCTNGTQKYDLLFLSINKIKLKTKSKGKVAFVKVKHSQYSHNSYTS